MKNSRWPSTSPARWPGGRRDRKREARVAGQQAARDRRLARPRGRGQHQHQAAPLDLRRHAHGGPRSFDVLDLLAQLLDHGLQLEPDPGQLHIRRLGAERVGLAVELLAQEVEPPPDRGRVAQQPAAPPPYGRSSRSISSRISALVASSAASWASRSSGKRRRCLQQLGDLGCAAAPSDPPAGPRRRLLRRPTSDGDAVQMAAGP